MYISKNRPPIEDLLEGTGLGKGMHGFINQEGWNNRVDVLSDETALATYTARFMRRAVDMELCDDNLLNAYQECFKYWHQDLFDRLPCRLELKFFLRKRGVFTGKNNRRITDQLFQLLTIEQPLAWNKKERATTVFHHQCLFERERNKHK
ncbi:hypothetical protein GcM1_199015 [Golovinomyces cichoracearum]|uniref:Uncharacterized protein n=1 Tax=Golovinomyces cichoracearum TaxID=62708 RepID=A0A420IZ14_9PEZI|nr:hypothetical protein GcM1_199015 [Golovinomyces cichoracearum]